MYGLLAAVLMFIASVALAEDPWWESCRHVSHLSEWLLAKAQELPEDRLHLMEEGRTPEEYAFVLKLKHDAYHDIPALEARVRSACVTKESS